MDIINKGLLESKFGTIKPHVLSCPNLDMMLGVSDPMIYSVHLLASIYVVRLGKQHKFEPRYDLGEGGWESALSVMQQAS
jgi:hypothetical protein